MRRMIRSDGEEASRGQILNDLVGCGREESLFTVLSEA